LTPVATWNARREQREAVHSWSLPRDDTRVAAWMVCNTYDFVRSESMRIAWSGGAQRRFYL
jgi:hypothetical protein